MTKKVKPWLGIFYDAPLLTKLVTAHFCQEHIFIYKLWILGDISGLSKIIISVVVFETFQGDAPEEDASESENPYWDE